MIEVTGSYSLTAEWYRNMGEQLATEFGAVFINDKFLTLPGKIANGSLYYSHVLPGLSVVVADIVFKEPILIKRTKGNDDLYIILFDFSDNMNMLHIEGEKHKIGYKENLGLVVLDNTIANSFQPVIGERVYTIRLIVAKELLDSRVDKDCFKALKKDKDKFHFYHHIDSESKVLMHDIKNRIISDPGFEIWLKGVSLKLLAMFVDRYSSLSSTKYKLSDAEANGLNETYRFLLNNLQNEFPGILFLAEMAGMSGSKYKLLFKKIFLETPNKLFVREKMVLANKLLNSGEFYSVDDILRYLRYKKMSHFSSKYYNQFGRMPLDDLAV